MESDTHPFLVCKFIINLIDCESFFPIILQNPSLIQSGLPLNEYKKE
jgi:hypothetical protein